MIGSLEEKLREYEEENALLLDMLNKAQKEYIHLFYESRSRELALESRFDDMGGLRLVNATLNANKHLDEKLRIMQDILKMEKTSRSLRDKADLLFSLRDKMLFGGKGYPQIMIAHEQGGMEKVETLLDAGGVKGLQRANIYTALARRLNAKDKIQAAIYARKAWENDPRPFRYKWLAFRLNDAGNPESAVFMLAMLSDSIIMNESEQKKFSDIQKNLKNKAAQASQAYISEYIEDMATGNDIFKTVKSNMENEIHALQKMANKYKLKISRLELTIESLKNKLASLEEENKTIKKRISSDAENLSRIKKEKDELIANMKEFLTNYQTAIKVDND